MIKTGFLADSLHNQVEKLGEKEMKADNGITISNGLKNNTTEDMISATVYVSVTIAEMQIF